MHFCTHWNRWIREISLLITITKFLKDERSQRPTVFLTSFLEETFTRIQEKVVICNWSESGKKYFPGKIRRMTGKDAADVCSQEKV